MWAADCGRRPGPLFRTGTVGRVVHCLSGQYITTSHRLGPFPAPHGGGGFCFLESAVYDTLAAEETWSKIFAMWDRNLK